MFIADCHSHCLHSHDSKTPVKEMLDGAVKKGAGYLALTDHCDKDCVLIPGFEWVRQIDLDAHIQELDKVKQEYTGVIEVGIGLELGYYAPAGDMYAEITRKYPTDVIINSVHIVNCEDCYYPSYFERDRALAYGDYLRAVRRSIDAPYNYDIIGHIGYVARKAPYSDRALRYSEFPEMIDDILKAIIDKGKALEVNGRGPDGTYAPTFDIVKRYRQLGGELVTFGSDAHNPDYILINYDKVVEGLKAAGFRYIFRYLNHRPIGERII
ncbi:MAG: histidinol-phosphatase HisJ family protein [Clostridia bacterium]|nr:histidinol-phosphatase HisJ family protein [Clostridia bacterium]